MEEREEEARPAEPELSTVAEFWRLFEERRVPKNISVDERRERQHHFYSGAGALLDLVSAMAQLPDDEGHSVLDALYSELDGWMTNTAIEVERERKVKDCLENADIKAWTEIRADAEVRYESPDQHYLGAEDIDYKDEGKDGKEG